MSTIIHKKSSVAAKVPLAGDLQYGELAINYEDEKLYFKNSAGQVKSWSRNSDVYAKATEAILKGQLVMFAGAQGDHILVSKANLNAVGFIDTWIVGVANQNFATNDFGDVTWFGNIEGIDTSAWPNGTVLYASTTVGGLTSTKPTQPNHIIQIAAVTRSHANEGSLIVRPTFGMHLGDLHDVYVPSPANDNTITWNSTTNRWESTELKTINGTSILGSGDIAVQQTVEAVTTTNLAPGELVVLSNDGSGTVAAASTLQVPVGLGAPQEFPVALSKIYGKYDAEGNTGRGLVIAKDASTGRPSVGVINLDTGEPWMPVSTQLSTSVANDVSVDYDPYTTRFITAYSTSNGVYLALYQISGDTATVVSGSQNSVLTGTAVYSVKVLHGANGTTTGGVLLIGRQGYGLVAYMYNISGDTIGIVTGTPPGLISSNASEVPSAIYDPTENKTLVVYATGGNGTISARTFSVDPNTGVFTMNTPISILSNSSYSTNTALGPTGTPSLFALSYSSNSSNTLNLRTISLSGTSITLNTNTTLSINSFAGSLAYDPYNSKVYFSYSTGNLASAYLDTYSISGTNLVNDFKQVQISSIYPAYSSLVYHDYAAQRFVVYGNSNFYSFIDSETVSNLTPSSYLGVSAGTYLQNTLASILTDGTLSSNHSQLTPGWVYYANEYNQITSSETAIKVGIAVSNTTLLLDTSNKYISSTNIANWNDAYTWGNHNAAGYLNSTSIGLDVQAYDADLTSIAGLAGTSGLLKKTAANTWALDTNTYLTSNQSITVSGDATGSGTTSISLTLANSGVTAGTYKSVTVDSKGRVTGGTNPTTLSGYGITDAQGILVSGTNIKTINGTSILGSGDISVSAGSSPLSVGSTPPADPSTKPFWWDNTSGILKIYYTDQDSSQWVDATPAGFSTSQGSGITTGKAIAMAIVFG